MNENEQNQPGLGEANPQAFIHNLAKLYEEYGKAVAAFVEPREKGTVPIPAPTDNAEVVATLTKVAESWLSDPRRAVALQTELWTNYIDLWGSAFRRLLGEPNEEAVKPDPKDKRFQNMDWTQNIFFDFCKQLYLITTRWAEEAVESAEGLDDHTRDKARFYVQQISSALSPSNFVLTNPELLAETLKTSGENLVRGMAMLAEDIKAGHGDIKLRQTDEAQFALGKTIATTEGAVIYQNELMQLIQYKASTETVFERPTLIIPPWINKFYILDLNPEKSFIKWMVDQGQTVFCISWVNPDATLRDKDFEDYMRDGILKALDAVHSITGAKNINAVGYCVGGTLLAATLAYLADSGKQPIATATFLAAQVDFTYGGDLKVFIDEPQISALEETMNKFGYLDSKHMASTFNMLRANELIWPYFINTYLKGQQPSAFDLLYWNSDSTRMTPANHSFYLRQCYLRNTLAKGEMILGGKRLDLKKVTCPAYFLATKDDHIAPAKSVFYGTQFFGGSITFTLAASGHIAGVINPPARHKYNYWTGAQLAQSLIEWQKSAQMHDGSWWPHWQNWLKMQDNKKVAARPIGTTQFPPLEPAPGSYVRAKG